MGSLLAWALLPAAALHILEEFVWPGGFAPWYRPWRPKLAASMTPAFFILVNAVLLALCATAGIFSASPRGVALWLTVAALTAANGTFHVYGSISSHSYSPGTITGVLLYLPLALYGFSRALASGAASTGTAVIALLLGGLYQFWSNANHSRRARKRLRSTPRI
jgi:Protein of unknown function with HXXEE motif